LEIFRAPSGTENLTVSGTIDVGGQKRALRVTDQYVRAGTLPIQIKNLNSAPVRLEATSPPSPTASGPRSYARLGKPAITLNVW
jgi:hypothetical protein